MKINRSFQGDWKSGSIQQESRYSGFQLSIVLSIVLKYLL